MVSTLSTCLFEPSTILFLLSPDILIVNFLVLSLLIDISHVLIHIFSVLLTINIHWRLRSNSVFSRSWSRLLRIYSIFKDYLSTKSIILIHLWIWLYKIVLCRPKRVWRRDPNHCIFADQILNIWTSWPFLCSAWS